MSNSKVEELIDIKALNSAIEDLVNDKEIQNDVFRKNYDPHTKLTDIAETIDQADAASDRLSLSIASIQIIFSVFFALIQVFEYTPFEFIIFLFLILGIIISIFSIIVSGKKLSSISKEFAGHTFSYLDKQQLKLLLEERSKKFNLGIFGMIISSFLAIIAMTTISAISDNLVFFGISIFFLILGVGMYILLRTAHRKSHVKKVLDKSIQ